MSKTKIYKQAERMALVHMSLGANVTQAVTKVKEHYELDISDSLKLQKDLSQMCPHKA